MKRFHRAVLSFALLLALVRSAPADAPRAAPVEGPFPASESRTQFVVEPNLTVDLVAAEPLVVAPCALAFDARGRLFVAENRGYPTGAPDGRPLGRIVELRDADGDGAYDQRVEFAEDLTFPNGLLPWRDGFVVTCAPDVLFLRDRDGDGRADERKVLLTGFSTSGSTQLRVSHPTLSIDGWVYVTSGLTGGNVKCPDLPDAAAAELKRTDLRFQLGVDAAGLPRVTKYEPCDGGSQFGLSFDDFGRRFICYNRVQVQHVVVGSATWRRNPNLAFSETVQNCPADMSPEPVRGHGAAAKLFPLSRNVTTADSHAGTFTAACAVTAWRGTGLPAEYRGGVFSCDPTANVVHFDRLDPQGATFAARRVRDGGEFLASPDGWFRPVFLAGAPDGSLFVCDMYRKTIEHPDYLPVEIRKRTDFEAGRTMGRIWRVRRQDLGTPVVASAKLAPPPMDLGELTKQLGEANGWVHDRARRLLLERDDSDARQALARLADDRATSAVATAAALRRLDALGALDDERLARASEHPHPGVRETALELAQLRPNAATGPWGERLVARATGDADPRVRFVAAIGLGGVPGPAAIRALRDVALRDADDRWLRAVVLSSASGREAELLDAVLAGELPARPGVSEFLYELGRLLGASQPAGAWPGVLSRVVDAAPENAARRTPLLTGFLDALRARGAGRDQGGALAAAVANGTAGGAERASRVAASFERAIQVARADDQEVPARVGSLGLLAHADFGLAGEPLLALVDLRQPAEVQAGAVRALGLMRDERIAATLLDATRFPAYTPRLREDVLSTLLSNPQHLPGLLAAIESGVVPRGAVDSLRRRQLVEHRDPAIRERAKKLFDVAAGDRAKVYEDLKSLVSLTADPRNGQTVFKKTCSPCHRLDREGTPVGPDLFGIRNQPKEAILLHIVIPEHEITPGFAAYVATTVDGRVITGLIAAETPTSVTIRQALGKEETILRKDLEQLGASKLSLMPQEIEKNHTRQELADLIAYLKGELGAK